MNISLSTWIPAPFRPSHAAVRRGCLELVETGGRGSGKSSYLSIEFLLQLLRHPDCSGAVLRKVGNTLRTSVFAQLRWACDCLGVAHLFRFGLNPLEAEYLPTGQKILFLGMDDPGKLKSLKLPRGYVGLLWFEELDQFTEEEVRSAEQSLFRGGQWCLGLKSFNPPPDPDHWANRYARTPREGKFCHHSTYLDLPPHFLGSRFLADAEHLKAVNPTLYRQEYLGECVGTGDKVFPNVRLERIDPAAMEAPVSGVDWGWWPDPWAFNRVWFDREADTLYIFDEATAYRASNSATAAIVARKTRPGEHIAADSSERKSIADYRGLGLSCRPAMKGPGSVGYSWKWLQSLKAIVIDPQRCPDTAREFTAAAYKNGRLPETDNHHIDATRYATEPLWRKQLTVDN